MAADVYDDIAAGLATLPDEGAPGAIAASTTYASELPTVAPPTFPGDAAEDSAGRYHLDGDGTPIAVVLDSETSSTNRAEAALDQMHRLHELPDAFPLLVLSVGRVDADESEDFPSLLWPHRSGDRYLWASQVEEDEWVDVKASELGRRIDASTLADCTDLYRLVPTSLLMGTWHSQSPRQERHKTTFRVAKSFRSITLGTDPLPARSGGVRFDPYLNRNPKLGEIGLDDSTLTDLVSRHRDFAADQKSAGKAASVELSAVGLGMNPKGSDGAHRVRVSTITRDTSITFGGVRALGFGDVDEQAAVAARAVLVTMGMYAEAVHVAQPSVSLRSGCDLNRSGPTRWTLVRPDRRQEVELTRSSARELFDHAIEAAEHAGIAWGGARIALRPGDNLQTILDEVIPDYDDIYGDGQG